MTIVLYRAAIGELDLKQIGKHADHCEPARSGRREDRFRSEPDRHGLDRVAIVLQHR